MGSTVADIIETMLASVQRDVADPDASFKLRTARQMVVLCGEQQDTAKKAITEADIDRETLENLRRLGYLD